MSRTRSRTKYVCQQCGMESPGFYGRCPNCGTWDSMVETVERAAQPSSGSPRPSGGSRSRAVALSDVQATGVERFPMPIQEFNRVLGGGLVPGSLVLIGGDPGIGKSTLLLQVTALANVEDRPALFVSAEESAQQVKLRAQRLSLPTDGVLVLAETDMHEIMRVVDEVNPGVIVVDSIQTVHLSDLTSAAGSVSQVRECTARLMQYAKTSNTPVFIVGHVTKEGAIAGPRVLEHMVDAVLYLEGDRYHQYRILRAVKNRFGSTDEVGVFEMADAGLREVVNPSKAFLQERSGNAAGSAVAVPLEGSRPLLIELQALTTPTSFGLPRRTANGFDINRLQMLIAVLTKRVGMRLGEQDVFVNVVGGLRLAEPAADLGVVVAIASSYRERPVDSRAVLIGEVGLSGELRSVSQLDRRLNEAHKLGFKRAILPASARRAPSERIAGLELVRAASAGEAIEYALTAGER